MKKLVVLTGAGMSAESGISTFRDNGGLWEQYPIEDVASIDGWNRNPELVNSFYNARRKQLASCLPNIGHIELVALAKFFDLQIITQNVDDLHERAGSKNVLHLHGELTKACNCTKTVVEDIGYRAIKLDDVLADSPMRPFIVWFGEAVPLMDDAIALVQQADVFVVIGSSLHVYPAAGLLNFVPLHVPIFVIDPNEVTVSRKVKFIRDVASTGIVALKSVLL